MTRAPLYIGLQMHLIFTCSNDFRYIITGILVS